MQPANTSERESFVPTEHQLARAKWRICCVLDKFEGSTPVRSFGDAVDMFCKQVSNHKQRLGSYRNREFKITISTALQELIEDGYVSLNDRYVVLHRRVESGRRRHKQKYPRGGVRPQPA